MLRLRSINQFHIYQRRMTFVNFEKWKTKNCFDLNSIYRAIVRVRPHSECWNIDVQWTWSEMRERLENYFDAQFGMVVIVRTSHHSHISRVLHFLMPECSMDVSVQLEIAREHRSGFVNRSFGPSDDVDDGILQYAFARYTHSLRLQQCGIRCEWYFLSFVWTKRSKKRHLFDFIITNR